MADENLAVFGGPPVVQAHHRTWPELTADERAAVLRVLERGVLQGANAPEISALEHEYAERFGLDRCLVTNSGTAALHCGAAALGLGPGDEVIVPAYTFVASAMAMIHQGATVVFADVDDSFNLDPLSAERHISPRTRAILAVAIHGQPADLAELSALAEKHGLALIEDNAQAHGIDYNGEPVGTVGEAAAWSLSPSKNLPGGEGGIFTAKDDDAFLAGRRLTTFGEDLAELDDRAFWSHGVGWNYRGQELTCAIARCQLRRTNDYNVKAQANARLLLDGLAGVPGLILPKERPDRGSSWWKFPLQIDADALGLTGDVRDARDAITNALKAEGVQAMLWQPHPVPAQPAFRRAPRPWHRSVDQRPTAPWSRARYPVASRLCDRTLHLASERHPLYVQSTRLAQEYIQAVWRVMSNVDRVLSVRAPSLKRMI